MQLNQSGGLEWITETDFIIVTQFALKKGTLERIYKVWAMGPQINKPYKNNNPDETIEIYLGWARTLQEASIIADETKRKVLNAFKQTRLSGQDTDPASRSRTRP